jgi:hypothetical protein
MAEATFSKEWLQRFSLLQRGQVPLQELQLRLVHALLGILVAVDAFPR